MDGDLGNMVRGLAEQTGFYCLEKGYDLGFRQITARTKPRKRSLAVGGGRRQDPSPVRRGRPTDHVLDVRGTEALDDRSILT